MPTKPRYWSSLVCAVTADPPYSCVQWKRHRQYRVPRRAVLLPAMPTGRRSTPPCPTPRAQHLTPCRALPTAEMMGASECPPSSGTHLTMCKPVLSGAAARRRGAAAPGDSVRPRPRQRCQPRVGRAAHPMSRRPHRLTPSKIKGQFHASLLGLPRPCPTRSTGAAEAPAARRT